MNKTQRSRKLTLNKETIRTLQNSDLGQAVGGMMNPTRSCLYACGGPGGGGTSGTSYGTDGNCTNSAGCNGRSEGCI